MTLVLLGVLRSSAFAQYSQPPQTGYPTGYQPTTALGPSTDSIQLANQSDQQLFAEARLFEQQGRTAQAQRIYLELQRRSLIRAQGRLTPGVNRTSPPASTGYSTRMPSEASASAWKSPIVQSDATQSSVQSVSIAAPSTVSPTSTPEQAPILVLDRQVTPPTPQVEAKADGWRAAITPLPTSFSQVQPAAGTASDPAVSNVALSPLELKSEAGTSTPAAARQTTIPAGNAASDAPTAKVTARTTGGSPINQTNPLELMKEAGGDSTKELPNMPSVPVPDMPMAAADAAKVRAALRLDQEPPAFVPPVRANERQVSAAPPSAPAGIVTMLPDTPPTLQLSPKSAPRAVSIANDQETPKATLDVAARLAKQTDDIRIIPGSRGSAHSRIEDLLIPNHGKESNTSDAPFDPPTTGWKSSKSSPATSATQLGASSAEEDRDRREPAAISPKRQFHSRSDSVADSSDGNESRLSAVPRNTQADADRAAEPKPVFDLAALLKDPEFREIHTRPVLDGLELLSQSEPRHRLLGALRIGASGSEARTALPALRQLLGEESNKAVRLRIAEAIIKLQPNDRLALDVLSQLLTDADHAEIRQAAAGALGAASVSANATAIVRLTDALDDPSPRVRIMAALSLAQFGPAAGDAVPRLETAAANDVPRMQRAALAALASIRGRQESADSTSDAAPIADPRSWNVPPALFPMQNAPPAPATVEAAKPREIAAEHVNLPSAPARTVLLPAFQGPPNPFGESRPAIAIEVGAPQPWPTTPARGISLHEEIEADGANAEARQRHPSEPPRLPDVSARPIERSTEPPTPRPAPEPPKAATAAPNLSDDSPLNLESQSGSAKPGPSQ